MAVEQKLRSLLWTGYFLACYILMVDSQIFARERMPRVILTGAGVPHMGNVMVAPGVNQGQFRSVCDDFFSMKEANAVCMALGFRRALRFTRRNYFGKKLQRWSPDGWMSLYRLQCPVGDLKECRVLDNTQFHCTADEIAGVECQTDSTNYGCSLNDFICRGRPLGASKLSSLCISPSHLCDGMSHCPDSSDEDEDLCSEKGITSLHSTIRTELPENSVAGTILIKHKSTWGTFFGYGASEISARVACRALGYTRGIRRFFYQNYFGRVDNQLPVRGTLMQCEGHEPTLDQCPGFSWNLRYSHNLDTGVFCHDGDFSVRLVGGRTSTSGSLEITSTGASSPAAICDTGFDDLDAQVVCRMLGFDSPRSIAHRGSPFGMDSRNIWNIILDCYGDERSINDCKIKISSKPCNQRQTAAVTCMREHSVDQVLRSLLPADCGEPVEASTRFLTTLGKIRGGTTPSRFDIPWLAQLRRRHLTTGDYVHICGAVIISEFYLLTAAHCFNKAGRFNLIVSIGNYNINYNDPFQRDFLMDKVRVHELYGELGIPDNDIALIKIEAVNGQGIRFDAHVKPVCLPRVGESYEHLSSCQIAGWGKTSNSSRGATLLPKLASVAMSSDLYCENRYSSRKYTSSSVCVGGHNQRISCRGDSGGPLTCPSIRGRHILYGLTSYGQPCFPGPFPDTYTRMTKYLRWIQENIISLG